MEFHRNKIENAQWLTSIIFSLTNCEFSYEHRYCGFLHKSRYYLRCLKYVQVDNLKQNSTKHAQIARRVMAQLLILCSVDLMPLKCQFGREWSPGNHYEPLFCAQCTKHFKVSYNKILYTNKNCERHHRNIWTIPHGYKKHKFHT